MALLQFICQKIVGKFIIMPNQGTDKLYKTNIYALSLDYTPKATDPILPSDVLVLAEVNLTDSIIANILEVLEPSKAIDSVYLADLVKNNKLILGNKTVNYMKYPIPDDLYVEDKIWDFATTSVELGEYPLFLGPKGCGKTSLAFAVAKALKYNFYYINCSTLTRPKLSLIGSTQSKDGNTFLVKSQFMQNFVSDQPTLILLQELSRIADGADNQLLTVTEENAYLYIEELAEMVFKGPNVRFMADANFGAEYSSSRQQDGALMDRFTPFLMNYLPEDREISLIRQKIPGVNKGDVGELVGLANRLRAVVDQLQVGVSTRKLISMSKYLTRGFSVGDIRDYIFKNIFINGVQDNSEVVNKIFESI